MGVQSALTIVLAIVGGALGILPLAAVMYRGFTRYGKATILRGLIAIILSSLLMIMILLFFRFVIVECFIEHALITIGSFLVCFFVLCIWVYKALFASSKASMKE